MNISDCGKSNEGDWKDWYSWASNEDSDEGILFSTIQDQAFDAFD